MRWKVDEHPGVDGRRLPDWFYTSIVPGINGLAGLILMGTLASLFQSPLVFPSLGPTAFLFFLNPKAPASSPRNTLGGHFIGAVVGWASFRLLVVPFVQGAMPSPALAIIAASGTVDPLVLLGYSLAAGVSVGFSMALMVVTRTQHPPACATTLIFSLGLLPRVTDILSLMVAVAVLTGYALLVQRISPEKQAN